MSAVRNELFGTEFVSLVDESLFRHAAKASTKIKIKVVCPECGIGWTATPLDNGITLCKKCHRGFHEWMGGYKVKTTEGDFIKWKKQFGFQVPPP